MAERKIIRKWFWVWDFEKEERWLNEMAQSGWVLDKVGYCRFEFVPCVPGEYVVRLEMHPEDDGYVEFMKETGAEHIGNMLQWKYFRKKAEEGAFDIFSDIDSRLGHLNKIGAMLSAIGFANLILGLTNPIGKINLLCATVLMYGLGRIHGKKEQLEKDRLLQE